MTLLESAGTKKSVDPRYAWAGHKRATAARRLADAARLTAEADAIQKDIDENPIWSSRENP